MKTVLSKGPLSLEVVFNLQRPKSTKRKHPSVRPDLDNYIKSILDAVQGVLFEDDGQVVQMSARKQYSEEYGIDLKIKELA
jgi:Holliday junction resolvase RusA-like endonuclease